MPENTPQIRRNLGRNLVKSSRTRVSTMALRHLKKSEERQSVRHSLRTVGLGILALAWGIAIMTAVHYIGILGAEYGHHIVMTRAHKHVVGLGHAMAITGGFGVLWIIGGVLIAFTITCLVTSCFIPKHDFRLNFFGYYRDEDGQDLISALRINAIVAAIYAVIVAAISFVAMGLLTDMVRLTH
jgi:hypothetical protein